MSATAPRIALVGLACRYPGAASPEELWENALAGRRAFRRIPPERLRLEDYLPGGAVPEADSLYATEAAVLENWEFDRVGFRVSGASFRAADPAHWLALDTAARALADAGFPGGEGLPRETAGAVVGNSLTGEVSRAQLLRLRWPYVRRTVAAELAAGGADGDDLGALLERLEQRFKEPFEPPGEETLAGGLANTIAGRICNHFDLGGGGYTVDGACASSLLAVADACSALAAGDLDVALAGGVDLSLDPFELVGFSRAGALSPGEMWVYDRRSQGFLPGEGCGFAVLMRLEDALARGRRVLAVVAGWGVSSDGSGGLTRPEVEGQLRALHRAYRRAGFGPETVALFEGHGTGTAVGDAAELAALDRLRREAGAPATPAAVGSVKAIVGHTKAAAGVAGLIKAAAALGAGVLPPTVGCEEPHPLLAGDGGTAPVLRALGRAEPWPAGAPRRAGVSAMGFGGINAHLVLEGPPEGVAAAAAGVLGGRERLLDRTRQDAELLLLAAEDAGALARRIAETAALAGRLSRAELLDLAAELAEAAADPAAGGPYRCAVVASRPAEAALRLERARAALGGGLTGLLTGDGFALGSTLGVAGREPAIGLLFSGQGGRAHAGGGEWVRRFPEAEEVYRRAAELGAPAAGDGSATEVAQPAVVTASLAALAVLERLGVEARLAVGHSLGELAALCWAGGFGADALVRLAVARGAAMAGLAGGPGAMAGLACSTREAGELVAGSAAGVAAFNAPDRVVVSGPREAVRDVVAAARERGIAATPLPVAHAFHSAAMAGAAEALGEALDREGIGRLGPGHTDRPVFSTVTGEGLEPGCDLRSLLLGQLTAPVLFDRALERAEAAAGGIDLWLEAGPGRTLADLASRRGGAPAIALDAGGGFAGLSAAAGALFCLGAAVDPRALFRDRFTRPLPRELRFLANPCESAPAGELPARPRAAIDAIDPVDPVDPVDPMGAPAAGSARPGPPPDGAPGEGGDGAAAEGAIELVRRLVAARAELPPESVAAGDRMLSDLHLNSITVGQLVVEAARRLGAPPPPAPTDLADASVAEIAGALEELGRAESPEAAPGGSAPAPEGAAPWVRAFTVELALRPAPAPDPAGPRAVRTAVLAPPGVPGAGRLRELLAAGAGTEAGTDLGAATGAGAAEDVLVWLPEELDPPALEVLLDGARRVLSARGAGASGRRGRFALVHSGAGGAFARSLHLERRGGEVVVVEVPPGAAEAAEWVAAELRAAAGDGYREAAFDRRGVRRAPVLRLHSPAATAEARPPALGPEDLLLVSGGGRGIAAECALALARRTGCALALLGRSRPGDSPELAATLERLAAAGVRFRYEAADATDPAATAAAVERAIRALGPVTALLHAAGVNRPKLVAGMDLEDLAGTLAPKVGALASLLAAVDPERLRLLVAFGSIIARTGMPGEAHYGLANEALRRAVADFGRRRPGCRCLTVEWSAWSGTGMGERLASAEALRGRGISPIPPERGVERLLELLEAGAGADPAAGAVVVTGRFGEPPTVEIERAELPFLRFLERPRVHVPGVELVVEADLTPESDPYLAEHAFAGERLLPAVLGLEAMVQAAAALAPAAGAGGAPGRPVLEAVELARAIALPAEGRMTLRVAAVREPSGVCAVTLRSSATGFQVDHFRGRCRFEPAGAPEGADEEPAAELAAGPLPGAGAVPELESDLEPGRDLYGGILFHQGRFRRLRGYRRLRARECLAEIGPAPAAEPWFGRHLPPGLLLGDPGARDAAIHAVQASIPHVTVLPLAIERLEAGALDPGRGHTIEARERSAGERRLVYDLAIRDREGRIRERWHGLTLALVADAPRPQAWPVALLGPLIERRAAELASGPGPAGGAALGLGVTVQRPARSHPPGTAARRRAGDRALLATLGPGVRLSRGRDGRPEASDGRGVSLAYADGLVLAAEGEGAVGCDLELVVPREARLWRDLLGAARSALAEAVAREAGEPFDAAATRVWTAGESLVKAGLPADAPLALDRCEEGWVLLRSGEVPVATAVLRVRGLDRPVAAAVLRTSRSTPANDDAATPAGRL